MYIAECPEIGTVDQGETIEEAIENLKEATKLFLEESSNNESQKSLTSFIDAAKGSFSTPEEVDQFIRQDGALHWR